GEAMGSVYWIGGESGPPGWGIEPASPNSSDVINFAGPTAEIFSNECYGEVACGGTPTIWIYSGPNKVELLFVPPAPQLCWDVWDPVCGLGGTFGPLEAGHWEFFGNNPYATFSIEFDVVAAQAEPVSYHVDAADGNDLNDGSSKETAFATIARGIDAAAEGDTVLVWPGVYTGGGNRDLDFAGKAITVRSTEPEDPCVVAATIIDCNGSEGEPHRGFYFHSGEDGNSIVEGLSIINGDVSGSSAWPEASGGGIFCYGAASPTIKHCIMRSNSATWGGAICYYQSYKASIGNCVISGNDANYGGGVMCRVGMMSIADNDVIMNKCTFSGNSAEAGGAVLIGEGSNPSIANCILWGNNATYGPEIAMTTVDWGSALCISFSDVEGGQGAIYDMDRLEWGPGNIDTDPCFADPCGGDYHLKSAAGRWDANSESWVADASTSPCIDAGNPGCPLGDEPNDVNNVRINMGAYGGTVEASKSPANWALLADLTNDGVVDSIDLGVFVDDWAESGVCVASDLDRSEFVDFADFDVFAQQWSSISAGGASMEYEITACGMKSAAVESGETRFTATVVGSYIYFEDMMTANCCPDELLLEMDVDGNVITLYEREVLSMPCLCICDYPVTATLGPFEAGVYTLEVYEDYGGSIGSTIVTIGP
ncbi:MAG: hypothetical protein JSV99_04660, partial [Planctomycetota bacterium]